MTNIIELKDYFQAIVQQYIGRSGQFSTKKIFFKFGTEEFVLNTANSQVDYPLFWLEVPDATMDDRGTDTKTYSFAFVIITDAPADAEIEELNALKTTEAIVDDMISRIKRDSEKNEFKADISKFKSEAIMNYEGDNLWGWRVSMNITTFDTCYCFEEDFWNL